MQEKTMCHSTISQSSKGDFRRTLVLKKQWFSRLLQHVNVKAIRLLDKTNLTRRLKDQTFLASLVYVVVNKVNLVLVLKDY